MRAESSHAPVVLGIHKKSSRCRNGATGGPAESGWLKNWPPLRQLPLTTFSKHPAYVLRVARKRLTLASAARHPVRNLAPDREQRREVCFPGRAVYLVIKFLRLLLLPLRGLHA